MVSISILGGENINLNGVLSKGSTSKLCVLSILGFRLVAAISLWESSD